MLFPLKHCRAKGFSMVAGGARPSDEACTLNSHFTSCTESRGDRHRSWTKSQLGYASACNGPLHFLTRAVVLGN